MIKLMLGDCLDRMAEIEDRSVDMVLADIPYGSTACTWDAVIALDPMWTHLKRVIKNDRAIVLTGIQPFSSALVMSDPTNFRYDWTWIKNRSTNFLNSKKMPLSNIEYLLVFSENRLPVYYPQMSKGKSHGTGGESVDYQRHEDQVFGKVAGRTKKSSDLYYPNRALYFDTERGQRLHPTQKPVALMAYMIRTYTQPGDTVLDFAMGSGTTGEACILEQRNFIGIELYPDIFEIAHNRLA